MKRIAIKVNHSSEAHKVLNFLLKIGYGNPMKFFGQSVAGIYYITDNFDVVKCSLETEFLRDADKIYETLEEAKTDLGYN